MAGGVIATTVSAFDWAVIAVCVALVAGGVRNLPRIWRHEFAHLDRMPASWPFGEALWRGYVRGMPAGTIAFGLMVAAGLLLALVPEEPAGPFVRPYWAVILTFAVVALGVATIVGVVFFNRPKIFVPPHQRRQPGAVAEWIADRRRKRGRSAQ